MAMAALRFFIILSPFGFLSLVFYFITLIGKTKPVVPASQRKDFFLLIRWNRGMLDNDPRPRS
jgi:hypothetical protein